MRHGAGHDPGSRFGLQLYYSRETGTGLDTGGGILRALPLLGDAPFVVVNGDIWTDYPWEKLLAHRLAAGRQAHLVMAPNPEGGTGDFVFSGGMLQEDGDPRLTFTGISLLSPGLFSDASQERFPLRDLLRPAVHRGAVSAELLYRGMAGYRRPTVPAGTASAAGGCSGVTACYSPCHFSPLGDTEMIAQVQKYMGLCDMLLTEMKAWAVEYESRQSRKGADAFCQRQEEKTPKGL